MNLIIGGAYQGKRNYVLKEFQINPGQIADGETISLNDALSFLVIDRFHRLILRTMDQPFEIIEQWLKKYQRDNPNGIIICDEVGCGIVPIQKEEEDFRERMGRVCGLLARESDRVVRVYCGIPTVLKEAVR